MIIIIIIIVMIIIMIVMITMIIIIIIIIIIITTTTKMTFSISELLLKQLLPHHSSKHVLSFLHFLVSSIILFAFG